MGDVVKKVDRIVLPTSRTQNFTQADASQGDILLVKDSLGHAASHVTVEAFSLLQLRFNVYHKVFPKRKTSTGLPGTYHLDNLTSGMDIIDTTGALVTVEAGTTYELDNEFPINDIELVTVSGLFDIFVS